MNRPNAGDRVAAIAFCLAPMFTALFMLVDEPSHFERVLWVGVEALMILAALLNLLAAFSKSSSPDRWLSAFLANVAVAVFILAFVLARQAWVVLVQPALVVGPALAMSLWNWRVGRRSLESESARA